MRKILDGLYTISAGLAALSLASIAAIVFGQVVFNTIDYVALRFFDQSFGLLIPSYSLFSGYALGFATFLSLGLGLRKAVLIRVTLLESKLPSPIRRGTLTIIALLGVMMGVLFTYSLGVLAYESFLWGDRASGLVKVPLWIPQSVLSLGSAVFLVAALDTLQEVVRTGRSDALVVDSVAEEVL